MTDCQCPLAGYCETHKRRMSERQHRQCRDEPGMFAAFAALPAMPSMGQRAKNLGRAIGRSAKAVATGGKAITPPDELAARKAACATCDHEQAGWCGKCGCVLAAKQRLATETCPLGRWPTTGPAAEQPASAQTLQTPSPPSG